MSAQAGDMCLKKSGLQLAVLPCLVAFLRMLLSVSQSEGLGNLRYQVVEPRICMIERAKSLRFA